MRCMWDAESRLVRVRPTPDDGDLSSAWNAAQKVEFKYDYMGRRVEKAVFEWEAGSPGSWELLSRTRFVYDGWSLIQELNVPTSGDPTVLRQYTWGLDLSGQSGNPTAGSGDSSPSGLYGAGGDSTVSGLHGASGIGGLQSVYDTNGTTTGENATSDDKSYVFLYDANGDVGQLVEWASAAGSSSGMAWSAGRLAAKYEYDPYVNIIGPDADNDGNIAEKAGPYASMNPFRSSTKFFDAETGLYYYGYRYYSPRLGRWINRDPIGEVGGIGLYRAIANSPARLIGPLGRRPWGECAPGMRWDEVLGCIYDDEPGTGAVDSQPTTIPGRPTGVGPIVEGPPDPVVDGPPVPPEYGIDVWNIPPINYLDPWTDPGHRWFTFDNGVESFGYWPAVAGQCLNQGGWHDPREDKRWDGGEDAQERRLQRPRVRSRLDGELGYGACGTRCDQVTNEQVRDCLRDCAHQYESQFGPWTAGNNCWSFVFYCFKECCLQTAMTGPRAGVPRAGTPRPQSGVVPPYAPGVSP
ncbi:MAG: hypothetical protein IPM64_10850 [Phycisphaerales bacterium]|nr:hypothetical protein [Phycisphaerales bacterium]